MSIGILVSILLTSSFCDNRQREARVVGLPRLRSNRSQYLAKYRHQTP